MNDYTVEHLFLLMGENPLPNAIAALTLLAPQGKPYLIFTLRTQVHANYLANVLGDFPHLQPVQLINLGTGQTEASVIRTRIQAVAQSLKGAVGIHYTGGTRVMAVHAYRAIEACHPAAVFSYLDTNSVEMVIDRDEEKSLRFPVKPRISLEQLFRLHGLQWQPERQPLRQPIQSPIATQLAQFHESPQLQKDWQGWCQGELYRQAKREYRWQEEAQLARLPPLELDALSAPYRLLLQDGFGGRGNQFILQDALKYGFQTITQCCDWLDGQWLAHYALAQVQEIADDCQIHDSHLGFLLETQLQSDRPWQKFEFDVAFMHHAHLFALVCTPSDQRTLCKQKFLDASVRARQLGGTEARVGLVCCYDYPDTLRSELERVSRNKKVAVFGRADLRSLGQKLATWVKQVG
jgi:hypothetical protein